MINIAEKKYDYNTIDKTNKHYQCNTVSLFKDTLSNFNYQKLLTKHAFHVTHTHKSGMLLAYQNFLISVKIKFKS